MAVFAPQKSHILDFGRNKSQTMINITMVLWPFWKIATWQILITHFQGRDLWPWPLNDLERSVFQHKWTKKHHFGGCITREPYIAGIREWAHCKQAFIALWARPTSNSCDVWLSCNTLICRVLIPIICTITTWPNQNCIIITQLWNPWCDIKNKSRIK